MRPVVLHRSKLWYHLVCPLVRAWETQKNLEITLKKKKVLKLFLQQWTNSKEELFVSAVAPACVSTGCPLSPLTVKAGEAIVQSLAASSVHIHPVENTSVSICGALLYTCFPRAVRSPCCVLLAGVQLQELFWCRWWSSLNIKISAGSLEMLLSFWGVYFNWMLALHWEKLWVADELCLMEPMC